MNKSVFIVSELDCPSEEKLIRNKLKSIKEITSLEFNFINQELKVTHTLSDIHIIETAIAEIGMHASIKDASVVTPKYSKPLTPYTNWIVVSIAGIIAIVAEICSFLGSEQSVAVYILSFIAIVMSGRPTFKKGYLALRSFALNINFLMMIAIIGAVCIGEWPEAAMVTVLFAIAELLESYSLEKARHAIEGLMEMAPEEALVQIGDNWELKPVAEVTVGNIAKVKPGERIPMDGILTSGYSSVNQAPITGESMPVEKNIGDLVFAGTINERGSFEFKVTAVANQSLLSRIIHAVEEAQSVKAPTQRFVDQFSKYYTPSMVILAVLIAIIPPLIFAAPFSLWFYKALVLLVIACPCALVISTPVTVVSALAASAKIGLLIKGGTYLENGHKIRVIALDKTGTLTIGKPIVTDIQTLNNTTEKQLLTVAASLDINSEHPIAHAIISYFQTKFSDKPLEVSQFSALPGYGVSGYINQVKHYLGNHQLAENNHICNQNIEKILEKYEGEGKTTIIISTDKQAIGILAVADSVRANSKEAIEQLHQIGIRTVMITGDNSITANAIGKAVGIDEIYSNMLPNKKLETIDNLIKKYHYVGMVGDGINDAPALAKASIGFAMGKDGTDIALETADVALMENNLTKLPLFIKLSKKTAITLIQNISFAIIVKIIFFILALTGQATLWMAVFADMGASLIVVFNGLKLLGFNPSKPKSCCHDKLHCH